MTKVVLRAMFVSPSVQTAAMGRQRLMEAGYELILGTADTEEKLAAELEAASWEVVLADYSSGSFSAPQALAVLERLEHDIPFIVLSRLAGEAAAVDMMRRGAHDYLMENDLSRLPSAIRCEIEKAHRRRARRLEEAELQGSEAPYRDLVEHSHDLMCRHDLTGRVLYINQNAAIRLGYTAEAVVGRNVRDALIPEYRDGFDSYIEELRKNGVAQGIMVVQTRKGEKLVWEYTNSLRGQGEGAIVRGIAHDITEQWKAQKALKASQSELRALFAGIDDQVLMLDSDGKCISVAPTAFRHRGPRPADLAGESIDQIFGEDHGGFFLENIRSALERESPHRVEYRLTVDGRERWFEGTISPVSKDRVIWIARDITERKRAEDALRRSEDQLRQSQKLEAIGQLAGGVAHDFNNLLTVINGHSDLLLHRLALGDPIRLNVAEIAGAGDRAASLTRQLLAFGRKQFLNPQVLDLNSVVVEIERMLQALLGGYVELRLELDLDLGRTKADRGQIEQVIMNLAVNARDAMPHGGRLVIRTADVTLDAGLEPELGDMVSGRYVMLAIADTGEGMDDKTRTHIFEPFFTTKELGKGTGLGLSTVYGIISQSGGRIGVSSEPGVGTTFRIYLPRVDDETETLSQ
ncbi:MAG TPA: PAS domain S-box protein [Blastocatellia bacterium]